MSITALFVGGPLDGEEREMREAPYVYSVPVFPEPLCIITDGPCEEAVSFERVDYRRAGRWSVAPGRMIYTAPGVDPTDAGMRRWFYEREHRRITAAIASLEDIALGWNEIALRWENIAARLAGSGPILGRRADVVIVDDPPSDARPSPLTAAERQAWLDRIDPDHTIAFPDAHTVRFSEMSAEAEAELAAWDEMLHGRKAP